jgi:hypothetical protein
VEWIKIGVGIGDGIGVVIEIGGITNPEDPEDRMVTGVLIGDINKVNTRKIKKISTYFMGNNIA